MAFRTEEQIAEELYKKYGRDEKTDRFSVPDETARVRRGHAPQDSADDTMWNMEETKDTGLDTPQSYSRNEASFEEGKKVQGTSLERRGSVKKGYTKGRKGGGEGMLDAAELASEADALDPELILLIQEYGDRDEGDARNIGQWLEDNNIAELKPDETAERGIRKIKFIDFADAPTASELDLKREDLEKVWKDPNAFTIYKFGPTEEDDMLVFQSNDLKSRNNKHGLVGVHVREFNHFLNSQRVKYVVFAPRSENDAQSVLSPLKELKVNRHTFQGTKLLIERSDKPARISERVVREPAKEAKEKRTPLTYEISLKDDESLKRSALEGSVRDTVAAWERGDIKSLEFVSMEDPDANGQENVTRLVIHLKDGKEIRLTTYALATNFEGIGFDTHGIQFTNPQGGRADEKPESIYPKLNQKGLEWVVQKLRLKVRGKSVGLPKDVTASISKEETPKGEPEEAAPAEEKIEPNDAAVSELKIETIQPEGVVRKKKEKKVKEEKKETPKEKVEEPPREKLKDKFGAEAFDLKTSDDELARRLDGTELESARNFIQVLSGQMEGVEIESLGFVLENEKVSEVVLNYNKDGDRTSAKISAPVFRSIFGNAVGAKEKGKSGVVVGLEFRSPNGLKFAVGPTTEAWFAADPGRGTLTEALGNRLIVNGNNPQIPRVFVG